MHSYIRLLLFAFTFTAAAPVLAKPVSYAGGVSPMIMNNGEVNAASIMYSPTARYAIGYGAEYWRDKGYTIQALQLNNLIKRWNFPDAQANIYLQSGIGLAYSDTGDFGHELEPAAFTGVLADWENRRFFVSYENRFTEAGDIDNNFMQSARVGVAPYVGEFNDLHTWLMVEVGHYPEAEDKVTVTPLVRFFKGTHLIEAGMSNQGDLLFNWMINFKRRNRTMKKLIIITVLLVFPFTASATETAKISVNGLVCDFCARAIEKIFTKDEAVESVTVDLTSKIVTAIFKDDKTLSDDELKKLVTDAGYNVVEIKREKD